MILVPEKYMIILNNMMKSYFHYVSFVNAQQRYNFNVSQLRKIMKSYFRCAYTISAK